MKRSLMFIHLTGLAMAGLAMAEEIDNGGGGGGTPPWVAGEPLTSEKQPAPGEIGLSPSSVPIVVADPAEYRVPRTDEKENPVPERTERVAEAPRLHAVEGRDKWVTTPLTTLLAEQRMIRQQNANPVTKVTNAPKTSTGAVGTTVQLKATVAPVGAAPDVVWTTSDATKATVDQTGKVTRVAAGSATITATSVVDSTKKDTTEITVS